LNFEYLCPSGSLSIKPEGVADIGGIDGSILALATAKTCMFAHPVQA
jgi:hypothetical protein